MADRKVFGHPVDYERFGRYVESDSTIVDVGCGYGRLVAELDEHGYRTVLGVDPSPAMIARARRHHPQGAFEVWGDGPLPLEDASVDAALLFTVLTATPADDDQRALIGEIERVLRPRGILYLSDMPLQDNDRNRARYEVGTAEFDTYGVFRLPEGAVCRHHDRVWFAELTAGFETVHVFDVDVRTMNGNPARAFQWIGRKVES